MKKIGKNTKMGRHFLQAYNSSRMFRVTNAYNKPSEAKLAADCECLALCSREGGYDYRIISAGIRTFSAGWLLADGRLRVETAHNSYVIE